jgi:vacuolar-type H+-ATPase subunit H
MQDILAEIIKVEKEIQKRLEAEEEKARQWVEQVKMEMEEKVSKAEERFKELLESKVEEAKTDAHVKASEILKDVNSKAERIENLSDEILKTLVINHISRVLPE